jgi:hypothetical protein
MVRGIRLYSLEPVTTHLIFLYFAYTERYAMLVRLNSLCGRGMGPFHS